MIHVIVGDDQALIRGALSALIDLEDDMEVVAQAGNGHEALAAVEAHTSAHPGSEVPLVVIMDVEMPVMDGISTATALKERGSAARVLMVTTFGRPGYVQRALDAGALGFVVKDAPAAQLLDAIRRTSQGLRGRRAHERPKPAQRPRSRGTARFRKWRDRGGRGLGAHAVGGDGTQLRELGDG